MRMWLVKKLLKGHEKGLIEEALFLASDTWSDCATDPEMHKHEDDMNVAKWAREAAKKAYDLAKSLGGS